MCLGGSLSQSLTEQRRRLAGTTIGAIPVNVFTVLPCWCFLVFVRKAACPSLLHHTQVTRKEDKKRHTERPHFLLFPSLSYFFGFHSKILRIKCRWEPGTVVRAWDPSHSGGWGRTIMNLRPAWAASRDLVSKTKQHKKAGGSGECICLLRTSQEAMLPQLLTPSLIWRHI
jgi:hypothetical protein